MMNPISSEFLANPADNTRKADSTRKKDTPEALANAASQFEAVMIGQFLQAARAGSDSGWLGTDSDDAGSTLTEMSEQALSSSLAANGGLGLSKMIVAGLQKTSSQIHPPAKKEN